MKGKTYDEVCYSFDGAVVCGYQRDGKLSLNPLERSMVSY
jgi:hypothetical protein